MKKLLLAMLLISAAGLVSAEKYNLPGYVTEIEDGRLWVFKEGSADYEEFKKSGEPGKQFTNIGDGPDGMTVKSSDQQTLDSYLRAYQNK